MGDPETGCGCHSGGPRLLVVDLGAMWFEAPGDGRGEQEEGTAQTEA